VDRSSLPCFASGPNPVVKAWLTQAQRANNAAGQRRRMAG
jgi:hypothetical protein